MAAAGTFPVVARVPATCMVNRGEKRFGTSFPLLRRLYLQGAAPGTFICITPLLGSRARSKRIPESLTACAAPPPRDVSLDGIFSPGIMPPLGDTLFEGV